jgi:polyhydroxybutyrate depolymerase
MKAVCWIMLTVMLLTGACNRPRRERPGAPAVPTTPRPAIVQSGSHEGQITSGGANRHYILHVPAGYTGRSAVPLLLNFHGYGSNSRQEEALSGTSAKADREGYLVVYPDGLDKAWHTGPGADGQQDRRFVRDLVAYLESQYNIDAKRIYATGLSNGGGMTDRLGCSMADIIAAIAPDSGAYNFWQDCQPSRPVPVLAFHGLDDNVVPYEGGRQVALEPPIEEWAAGWASRDGCNPTPAKTTPVETVTVRAWSGCEGGAEVVLYTLADHGHSWPGSAVMPRNITSQAVNATDIMWDFFMKHPMP